MKKSEGVSVVKRLSQKSDVLIEPFRPGTHLTFASMWYGTAYFIGVSLIPSKFFFLKRYIKLIMLVCIYLLAFSMLFSGTFKCNFKSD